MNRQSRRILFAASSFILAANGACFAASAPAGIPVAANGIGGVVTSNRGPEAGVWVIAETSDLPTKLIKIVVTDDQGRYFLPDLPKAKYQLFVRGYGLVDSTRVPGEPGKNINLTAMPAPDAKAAAQYYPPNYWLSLIHVPKESEFPGTGPTGNGIAPTMRTQQMWLQQMGDQCQQCHQQGDAITRNYENNSTEDWAERIKKARGPLDQALRDHGPAYATNMANAMTAFGRERGLSMWSDWTDRIAKGELPKEAPPRPTGIERNVVLTLWQWANNRYVHDLVSTDRHDPTVNANGPVYGVVLWWGYLEGLDVQKSKEFEIGYKIRPNEGVDILPPSELPDERPHNPMMDKNGTLWATDLGSRSAATLPDKLQYCTDPSFKFAKYFPQPGKARTMAVQIDPKTNKADGVPMCNSIHHLMFANNRKDLYFSGGDRKVVSWVDIDEWAKSHDPAKAVSWCPMVLDTNSTQPTKRPGPNDVTITADMNQWNQPPAARRPGDPTSEGGAAEQAADVKLDPTKDTRVEGFLYGVDSDITDGSMWFAKTGPFPGQLVRFTPGNNPPETCRTEMYEPPLLPDGKNYLSFNARGISVDSKGIAWGYTGSGQLMRFDRNACKVLSGPTVAKGQHCPEGWSVYDAPGPKLAGTKTGTADFHYLGWVDLHNTLGMGKDTVLTAGSNSDSLLAFDDKTKKYTMLRVPYPMGFRTRGMDGRIDDVNAGWKGRGVWATYSSAPVWHVEGGEDATVGPLLVKFQMRSDPLAN